MALIKCPECGGKVSTAANACPSCGHPIERPSSVWTRDLFARPAPPQQKKEAGCLAKFIAGVGGVVFLFWLIGHFAQDEGNAKSTQTPTTNQSAPDAPNPTPSKSDSTDLTAAAKLEKDFRDSVSDGTLYSFEPEKGVVRIDPQLWDKMGLQLKTNMINSLYLYFHYAGRKRSVQILSAQNDDVFAEFSMWKGQPKIIR